MSLETVVRVDGNKARGCLKPRLRELKGGDSGRGWLVVVGLLRHVVNHMSMSVK